MPDAGEFALRTERHGDLGRQFFARAESARFAVGFVIYLELPLAVERDPVFAEGIRARMFRARHREECDTTTQQREDG